MVKVERVRKLSTGQSFAKEGVRTRRRPRVNRTELRAYRQRRHNCRVARRIWRGRDRGHATRCAAQTALEEKRVRSVKLFYCGKRVIIKEGCSSLRQICARHPACRAGMRTWQVSDQCRARNQVSSQEKISWVPARKPRGRRGCRTPGVLPGGDAWQT